MIYRRTRPGRRRFFSLLFPIVTHVELRINPVLSAAYRDTCSSDRAPIALARDDCPSPAPENRKIHVDSAALTHRLSLDLCPNRQGFAPILRPTLFAFAKL